LFWNNASRTAAAGAVRLAVLMALSVMSDAQEMVPGRRRADSLFQAVDPVGLTSFRNVARRRPGRFGVT
jgi:hypothetical protein